MTIFGKVTISRKLLAGLLAAAGLQTAALAWMIHDRVALLRDGREIILPIVPVDPRSLFRGDYVRLGYPVSTVPVRLLEGPPPARHATFFVTIEKLADKNWQPVKVTAARPAATTPGQVVLAGRSRWGWPGPPGTTANINVQYGIERYYVPEGKGLELERMVGQKKLAAAIAVDGKGRAAIKGLAIDGKKVYDEPLL